MSGESAKSCATTGRQTLLDAAKSCAHTGGQTCVDATLLLHAAMRGACQGQRFAGHTLRSTPTHSSGSRLTLSGGSRLKNKGITSEKRKN